MSKIYLEQILPLARLSRNIPTHNPSQKIDFEEVKKDLDALYTSTDQVSVAAWFKT